jgi:hypothetical protein
MMDAHEPPRNWVAAGAGFAVALGLVTAVAVFGLDQSRSAGDDIGRLVREAEHSTYLIGDAGQLLSRMQANVLETLAMDASARADARARFESADVDLQAHLLELTAHLSADEREVWRAIEPEIAAVRASLGDVLDLVAMGRAPEAEATLRVLAGRARRVFDALQSFLEFNQLETRNQLDAAHGLLQRTRWVQGAAAAGSLLGIAAIGLVASRVIRRRELELSSYVRGVETENRDLVAFAGRVAHELPIYSTALRSAGSPWGNR